MAANARSMLFDLYGDYIELRRGEAWLGTLVRLGQDLGVSEQAVRSAATRMVRDDWLKVRRQGRRGYFSLTERGRTLIARGRERIFRRQTDDWDGCWYLLTFSVPEAQREQRDRMRKELSFLGFGSIGNALYLSPHDQRPALADLAQRYRLQDRLQLWHAQGLWPEDPGVLVRRAWNLEQADERYAHFLQKFGPRYRADRELLRAGQLDDRACFITRFELVNEFRRFPFFDPGLPATLAPPGWHGLEAQDLFHAYHELLTPSALRYFDRVVADESR